MATNVQSAIRPSPATQVARRAHLAEAIEPRLLLAVNSWAALVGGVWSDVEKWSLGHALTLDDPSAMTTPGSYPAILDVFDQIP